jgi:hypothetical protein
MAFYAQLVEDVCDLSENASLFLSAFPMFVPSLSWQNHRFYIKMAQKWRFCLTSIRPGRNTRIAPSGNSSAFSCQFAIRNRKWHRAEIFHCHPGPRAHLGH